MSSTPPTSSSRTLSSIFLDPTVWATVGASFGAGALLFRLYTSHMTSKSLSSSSSASSASSMDTTTSTKNNNKASSESSGMVRSHSMIQDVLDETSGNKFSAMSKRRALGMRNSAPPRTRMARLEDVHLLDCKDVLSVDRVGESPEYKIPHLSQWCPPFWYSSPCPFKPVSNTECIAADIIQDSCAPAPIRYFLRGGPREKIFFHPLEVRAAVVTCGGLCPGLNTVIREVVMCLHFFYGVREVFGVQYGYEGFYKWPLVPLTPDLVADIHNEGGTILASSRGGFDLDKIFDSIERHRLNQLYIIGGDGTHRGATKLHEEAVRRGLKISVCGICKTIDNDIPLLDRSFGFDTAVEEAIRAVRAAHVEIRSAKDGVGLVVVMGRSAGFIAMQSALAARDVNVCLIPEVKFDLYGAHGLLEYVRKRLSAAGHCLILCAEGAGLDLMPATGETDASGNPKLPDIGSFLKSEIKTYLSKEGIGVNLKYIDPSYMIRSVPPCSSDSVYCTILAQTAAHGCMAGFGGFSCGLVNSHHVMLPIALCTKTRNVDPEGRQWQRVIASTGMPQSFVNAEMARLEESDRIKQKRVSVTAAGPPMPPA